ncbi:MAG: transposase [Blastochloris sp.]|nr:transposase [Blastochloris sp.]
MPSKTFTVSVRFYWHNMLYEVERRLSDGQLLLHGILTGEARVTTRTELTQALYDGELHFVVGNDEHHPPPHLLFPHPTLEDCPPRLAQIVHLRWALVEPLQAGTTSRCQIATRITEFLEHCTPEERTVLGERVSVRTVYRWLARLREFDQDPRALIPQTLYCGGKGRSRLDAAAEQILTESALAVGRRETTTALHDEVRLRIGEHNAVHPAADSLSLPSRATVARRRALAKQTYSASQRETPQYGAFEMPDYPLERVEIDHTPTDLIVVDDDDHLPLGRLTLTYCVDVKSRLVTGYYLGFEPPSYHSVAECLYHAILPKPDTRTLYDTENTLDGVHGIPFALATDNGKEFHSQHFSDALALLGIRHDTMPRLSPEKKPFVERLFGTLNSGLFHIAPGTTLSNILQRRSHSETRDACIYLSQIDRALTLFLVDIYAQDSHAGLGGQTPMQVWRAAVEVGFEPRLPASANELHILLGRTTTRVLDRNGFVFERIRYNSNTPELRRLRQRLGERGEVKLKYHAGDLSRMHVYDPFERCYLAVSALDQEWTQGLSLWKHRLILQLANRESQRVDREALARARRKIRDLFEAGAQRKRYGRWKTNGQPARELATPLQTKSTPTVEVTSEPEDWQVLLEANTHRAEEWARQQHLIKEARQPHDGTD